MVVSQINKGELDFSLRGTSKEVIRWVPGDIIENMRANAECYGRVEERILLKYYFRAREVLIPAATLYYCKLGLRHKFRNYLVFLAIFGI